MATLKADSLISATELVVSKSIKFQDNLVTPPDAGGGGDPTTLVRPLLLHGGFYLKLHGDYYLKLHDY
jgi:hypothetical protein